MWTIFFLLVLLLLFFVWYTRTHLKEQALTLVMEALAKEHYQLLDETVSFLHMRVQREGKGFLLVHTFEFHYADTEQHRHIGQIIRHGKGWLNIVFKPVVVPMMQNSERKIIPFPGSYKHD